MNTITDSRISGLYEGDPNPMRRKGAPLARIFYRNHEIDCPACGQYIRTVPLSVTKAEFGSKQACNLCGHKFIYHYREPA